MNLKLLSYMNWLSFQLRQHFASFAALLIIALSVIDIDAQTMYTEAQVIESAIASHPSLKAASSSVASKKENEKAAFSLPGPTIYTQSPSGTFYTLGINQNVDFPTVYSNQKKLYNAETALAESQLLLSKQEITWHVRNYYNTAKYQTTLLLYLFEQDSLYAAVSDAATKQFSAGEIDFMTKTFATVQYENIHQKFLLQQIETEKSLQDVMMYCNLSEELEVTPYSLFELLNQITLDTAATFANAQLTMAQRETEIAKSKVKLEKSKAMPGFQFGYLNQVNKNSLVQYRFQAGITLPLWWWQYSGRIKAAKANAEFTRQQEEATILSYRMNLNGAQTHINSTFGNLKYYLETGLQHLNELETSSEKLYAAGEIDLITHLRALNDVMTLRFSFVEAAREYLDAVILLKFINGTN